MANLRASWGVSSDTPYTGVVVGVELDAEGQFITETDANGTVNNVIHYDTSGTAACDIIIRSNVELPVIGTQISIGGTTGYIKDARITESNGTYQKMHVTLAYHWNVDNAIDGRTH